MHIGIDSLQEAFINPMELCGVLFMMDGCTLFDFYWTIESQQPCTAIISCSAWKSQDILNITSIVFVWKKKVIYTLDGLRVSKSWGYFHFWVNYSLKMSVNHYRGSLGVVHPKMIIYRKCTYTQASKKWMNFLIRTDLEKCYIKSLAHQ